MNDYKFGNFICELRTEKGLSQSQLGDMMGVSNKAVSKWEMGVSKPRPDMLVALASFFGVTVEELLAGERNAQAERQDKIEKDDATLKLWAGEYRKKKNRGTGAVLTAVSLPFVLFIFVGVLDALNFTDNILGPIVMVIIFFAEAIDIALIFVFYGSARRLKRILYATYPEQSVEIAVLISPKRNNVPFLKWEKICIITGYSVSMAAYIVRILLLCFAEKNDFIDTINFVAQLITMLGLLFASVILIIYLIRIRRKK